MNLLSFVVVFVLLFVFFFFWDQEQTYPSRRMSRWGRGMAREDDRKKKVSKKILSFPTN